MEMIGSRMRRILLGCFACAGAVIAWTALSFAFDSTHAQAAEHRAGLLDDLTSAITDTATETVATVTDLVDEVIAPVAQTANETVAETVDPVLDAVASLPVAGPPAAGLVEESLDTVSELATPVVTALDEKPVAHAVDPVLDALGRLPIVGAVIEDLGPVVTSGIGGVDEVLGSVGGALEEVVGVVPVQPAEPAQPGDGQESTANEGHSDSAVVPAHARLDQRASESWSTSSSALSPPGVTAPEHPVQGTTVPALGSNAPPGPGPASNAPPGSGPAAPISSANGSGGSSGSIASIADNDVVPLRAWERTAGARDDAMPPAPVYDTDVSPG